VFFFFFFFPREIKLFYARILIQKNKDSEAKESGKP